MRRTKMIDRTTVVVDEGRSQIRWEDWEIELIAEALVAMREIDPVANMSSFIDDAQEQVLAPERRKKHINGMSQMPSKVLEHVQILLHRRAALVERGRRPDPEPPPPPPPPPTALEILGKMPTPDLVAYVSLRLFGQLDDTTTRLKAMEGEMKQIKTLLQRVVPAAPPIPNAQPQHNGLHAPGSNGVAQKERPEVKPAGTNGTHGSNGQVASASVAPIRVCIVGLLGGQQNEVRKRAPNTVELMFISQDAHEPKFPQSAEWIVLVKKFVKHNWTTAAFQARDRDKVFHVDGGITVLVKKLHDIGSHQRPSHKPT